MHDTILPTKEAVKDLLVDGTVTLSLVFIVASSIGVAVSIMTWIIRKFQTKDDAKAQKEQLQQNIDRETATLKEKMSLESTEMRSKIQEVHTHLHSMRTDMKQEQIRMQTDLSSMNERLSKVGSDISYIRAKMEGINDQGRGIVR